MSTTKAQVAAIAGAVTGVVSALAAVTATYGVDAGLVGLVFAVVATAMITLAYALAR
jgi:hypothetical protein